MHADCGGGCTAGSYQIPAQQTPTLLLLLLLLCLRTDYDGPLFLQSLHQGVIMVGDYVLVQQRALLKQQWQQQLSYGQGSTLIAIQLKQVAEMLELGQGLVYGTAHCTC
jgi:hypothetical protein